MIRTEALALLLDNLLDLLLVLNCHFLLLDALLRAFTVKILRNRCQISSMFHGRWALLNGIYHMVFLLRICFILALGNGTVFLVSAIDWCFFSDIDLRKPGFRWILVYWWYERATVPALGSLWKQIGIHFSYIVCKWSFSETEIFPKICIAWLCLKWIDMRICNVWFESMFCGAYQHLGPKRTDERLGSCHKSAVGSLILYFVQAYRWDFACIKVRWELVIRRAGAANSISRGSNWIMVIKWHSFQLRR